MLAEQREDHRRRSYSEGDNIRERIEFFPQCARDTQEAGDESVEEIENSTENDEEQRHGERAAHGKMDGDAAADEVAGCNGVGNMFFHDETN